MPVKEFTWPDGSGDKLTATYPGYGGGRIEINSAPNTSLYDRSIDLEIATVDGSDVKTLTVTQAGKDPEILVSPATEIVFASTSPTAITRTITTNAESFRIETGNGLTASPTTGVTGNTVSLQPASDNPSIINRREFNITILPIVSGISKKPLLLKAYQDRKQVVFPLTEQLIIVSQNANASLMLSIDLSDPRFRLTCNSTGTFATVLTEGVSVGYGKSTVDIQVTSPTINGQIVFGDQNYILNYDLYYDSVLLTSISNRLIIYQGRGLAEYSETFPKEGGETVSKYSNEMHAVYDATQFRFADGDAFSLRFGSGSVYRPTYLIIPPNNTGKTRVRTVQSWSQYSSSPNDTYGSGSGAVWSITQAG